MFLSKGRSGTLRALRSRVAGLGFLGLVGLMMIGELGEVLADELGEVLGEALGLGEVVGVASGLGLAASCVGSEVGSVVEEGLAVGVGW